MEFEEGDRVTILEGPFKGWEAVVDDVFRSQDDELRIRVWITIFGRQAPIELRYWQIQKAV